MSETSPIPAVSMGSRDCLAIICQSGDNSLAIGRLEARSGMLGPLRRVSFPDTESGPNGPSPMAISPDGTRIYVAFRGERPSILTYALKAEAKGLSFLGRAQAPGSLAHLSVDPTGRWLVGASYPDGLISVSPIEADGIAAVPADVITGLAMPHSTRFVAGGAVLLAAATGGESILRFDFDVERGRLTPLAQPAAVVANGSGPRHFVLSAEGRFAYVLNQNAGTVDAFAVGPQAVFSHLQTMDVIAPGSDGTPLAAEIRLTGDGNWLYASERTTSRITGFLVDKAEGRLHQVCQIEVPDCPRGFAVCPEGRLLVTLSETHGRASVFSIERDSGRLEQLGDYLTEAGPNWIELIPLP